jgi:hypothetical protein
VQRFCNSNPAVLHLLVSLRLITVVFSEPKLVSVPVANPRRAIDGWQVKLCVLRIVGLRVCWLERRLISEFPLRQPLKLTRSKLHVSK